MRYEREHLENGIPYLDGQARFELFAEQVEIVVRGDRSRPGDSAPCR